MEQQFILRLPEALQSMEMSEAKLLKQNDREVRLVYRGTSYPGIICRLPTIVESQKSIDGRLYKVADISTLIIIHSTAAIDNIDAEISAAESSGLTPSMAYVRSRRHLALPINDIEERVASLLREDARAARVEIIRNEESTTDLDDFAAEIEKDLPAADRSNRLFAQDSYDAYENAPIPATTHTAARPSEQLDESLGAPQAEAWQAAPAERPQGRSGADGSEGAEPPLPAAMAMAPELLDLQGRIREREEAVERTLNPILKKRFQQALAELKEEYERKRKQYGGTGDDVAE